VPSAGVQLSRAIIAPRSNLAAIRWRAVSVRCPLLREDENGASVEKQVADHGIQPQTMGGLAARHFATTTASPTGLGYRNFRNRNQGTFGTVLTIDTPHTGSALANYLVNSAPQELTAPPDYVLIGGSEVPTNLSYLLWTLSCDPSDTVQTCFSKMGMPLAPSGIDPNTGAGWEPDTGAVGSLQTTYAGISDTNAYPVLIPNANVGFLSASFPDSDQPSSLLRSVLNTLVNAIEWDQGDSVTKILGADQPNDVIVTVASQNANLDTGINPWQDLEHTGVPLPGAGNVTASTYESTLNLFNISDANVLTSAGVNQMALCFIVSGGTASCPGGSVSVATESIQANAATSKPCGSKPKVLVLQSNGTTSEAQGGNESDDSSPCSATTNPQKQSQEASPKQSATRTFLMNDRVEIMPPRGELRLAEEGEIPLILRAKGLASVDSVQGQYHGKDEPAPSVVFGSRRELRILHYADGSAYIKIIPMGLGNVQLTLSGRFPDGGIFSKHLTLDVGLPERKPAKLVVGQGVTPQSTTPVIFMHLAGHDRNSVNVNALYDNIKDAIEINPAFVNFTVRTRNNSQIIHLKKSTGTITPINVGQALVVTRFGGLKNLTCIVVTQNMNDWYDHSACRDLLQPGETLELPSTVRK
jgi:hypothetical protein